VLRIELEQEDDGRWLAEVPDLAGVIVYAATPEEAKARVAALALRTLADRLEHGEIGPRMLARIARHTGLTPDDL
jgi:predicted RNase H-like HicB family nuclease